jgi:hypothetical protein
MAKESLFRYGILSNVMLSPREYEELLTRLGRKTAEKYINELSVYIPNRRKAPYKNHFAVLLKWWLKDLKDDEHVEACVDDKETRPRQPESFAEAKIRRQHDAGRLVRESLRGAVGDRDGTGDSGSADAALHPSPLRFK